MSMPLMTVDEICNVISAWIKEELELSSKFEWVQIFENKGEGCSNPHPHCQIWASSFLPNEPRLEDLQQREYWNKNKRLLLRDYLQAELKKEPNRIVLSNDSWVVLVSVLAIIFILQWYIIEYIYFSSFIMIFRYHFGLYGHLKLFSYQGWMYNVCHNCHKNNDYI